MVPDKSGAAEASDRRSIKAEVSNRIVSLLIDATGRGPESARAYVHDELVVCVLRGNMGRVEQTLSDQGEDEAVLRGRRAVQGAIRERATAAIEEITGQKVIAFLSDMDLKADIAIEAFVLAPR